MTEAETETKSSSGYTQVPPDFRPRWQVEQAAPNSPQIPGFPQLASECPPMCSLHTVKYFLSQVYHRCAHTHTPPVLQRWDMLLLQVPGPYHKEPPHGGLSAFPPLPP